LSSEEFEPQEEREFKRDNALGFFSRRKLFSTLGFGSMFLAFGAVANGILAFIFPRLNMEPSSTVAVGRPEDYQVGTMKLVSGAQVYIFRDEAGFQAVSGICTHLGCAYKPFREAETDQYGCPVVAHCPCHGSVFCRDGEHVGGPAPRPLPFFRMELSPDGRLMVNKGYSELTDALSQASGEGVAHNLYFDPDQGAMVEGPYPTGEGTTFTT